MRSSENEFFRSPGPLGSFQRKGDMKIRYRPPHREMSHNGGFVEGWSLGKGMQRSRHQRREAPFSLNEGKAFSE